VLQHLERLFGRALHLRAPVVPEVRLELLRLAEAYEATQPSYAADLRTAALRPMAAR
jgi:hypothetical protein